MWEGLILGLRGLEEGIVQLCVKNSAISSEISATSAFHQSVKLYYALHKKSFFAQRGCYGHTAIYQKSKEKPMVTMLQQAELLCKY